MSSLGAFEHCPACLVYAERREPVLTPAIVETAHRHGIRARRLLVDYFIGVHERHLAGGSL